MEGPDRVSEAPRFSISVLAFNRIDLTVQCVSSIFANSRDFELILTDNGCTDGTSGYFEDLGRRDSRIRVIHNPENLGFQEPNRRALEMARGEFFVMLNNDCLAAPAWLESMAKTFDRDSLVAVCGTDSGCISLHPNFHGFRGDRFEYVEASCMMVRCDIVRTHGLFAPYLSFAYGEDSDLCLRMREKGFNIARADVVIRHSGQATSSSVPNIRDVQDRNHAFLQKRWAHYLQTRRMDYPIVLRRAGALGDVLLLTPIVSALKEHRPLSPIYIETATPEIFEGNAAVHHAARTIPPLPDEIRINLDMAYENEIEVPILDAYARRVLLNQAGEDLSWRSLSFVPRGESVERMTPILSPLADRPIVALHVDASSWPGKTWEADRWGHVAHFLRENGRRVVVVGSSSAPLGFAHDLDLRGQLSISDLAFTLGMSCLFVGVDSFPMHLAMSQGAPAVALFGAASPGIVLSEGECYPVQASREVAPCAGARHRVAGQTFVPCGGECMRAISVEMVYAAIQKAWAREAEELQPAEGSHP